MNKNNRVTTTLKQKCYKQHGVSGITLWLGRNFSAVLWEHNQQEYYRDQCKRGFQNLFWGFIKSKKFKNRNFGPVNAF